MVPRGTKRASSTSVGQPPTNKPTPVRSSPLQALPTRWHGASVRDSFEEEMDGKQDNNNNGDKVANDDSLLKEFSEDDDVQFTLF